MSEHIEIGTVDYCWCMPGEILCICPIEKFKPVPWTGICETCGRKYANPIVVHMRADRLYEGSPANRYTVGDDLPGAADLRRRATRE